MDEWITTARYSHPSPVSIQGISATRMVGSWYIKPAEEQYLDMLRIK